MADKERFVKMALDQGFSHAGLADVATLKPAEEVRDMCAVDKCRAYDRTWTCPPGCGTLDECSEKMNRYEWGILCQTTAELEDSMDWEAMMEAEASQKENSFAYLEKLREYFEDVLPLCSAGCDICKTCTYPDAPCRFPDKAVSAMEGYGLLVSQVCRDNQLEYYYGKNTVTYTALFLVRGEKK